MCVCSPEPVWLRSISAGLCGFRPRKDSGVFAKPGGERPERGKKITEVSIQLRIEQVINSTDLYVQTWHEQWNISSSLAVF